MATPEPGDLQQADIIPIRILIAVSKNSEDITKLAATIHALNEVLASHIRANLETLKEIREYIGNQLNYRLMREDMEEQRLRYEIAQKDLDLELMGKRVNALIEETEDADQTRLEFEKAKLEIELLRQQLETLKAARESTKDKVKPAADNKEKTLAIRMKETAMLTATSVVTASVLGGVLAFLYWGLRQWLLSAP
jgi:predicted nuclease with TOPRIM domain